VPLTGQETGIDVGLKVFRITADGLAVEHPRHYRKAEKRVAKANRRVSRRKQGSKRRGKAVGQLQRAHQRVKRQRADFHHQTALALLQLYDTIYRDDVRVANLVRNRQLAKSIRDAGWAALRAILDGKAAYAGRRAIAVPAHYSPLQPTTAHYTSQDWSGCGARVPNALSVRTHACPSCGLVLDRDANAARNIQAAGIEWAGQARRGVVASAAAMNRESARALAYAECQETPPFGATASDRHGEPSSLAVWYLFQLWHSKRNHPPTRSRSEIMVRQARNG
jgi:putative transposase